MFLHLTFVSVVLYNKTSFRGHECEGYFTKQKMARNSYKLDWGEITRKPCNRAYSYIAHSSHPTIIHTSLAGEIHETSVGKWYF